MSSCTLNILGICAAITASVANAAEALPKTGSISVHSGYYATDDIATVAPKHIMGRGTDRGITFNDKGAGPLHQGPTACFYGFDVADERVKAKGFCYFGDADGDRIFTDFGGASATEGWIQGNHEVTGGTGKYAGIQGSVTFKCKFAGANGELRCEQKLDYRLP